MADNGEGSHPPVFSKKRKTATRPRKAAKTNAVGAAQLQELFSATSISTNEPSNPESTGGHGESMDLDKTVDNRAGETRDEAPAVHTTDQPADGVTEEPRGKKPYMYSNEARIYMDRYDQVSKFFPKHTHGATADT